MGCFRGLGSLVLALLCFLGSTEVTRAASAAVNKVNHTVPQVTAPTEMTFSSPPLDAEFLRTGLFAEPLAPVAATTSDENKDLAQALFAYRDATQQSGAVDAVDPLLTFLAAHPKSAWTPALQLNMGMIYRQTGHFSKALEIWQSGWQDAQALSDPHGRVLANAMVARLSQLEAYLGRKELLQPLLDSIQGRPIGGTAAQFITDSHTGLYDMVYHPEESFRCGPLALMRILRYGNAQPSPMALKVLESGSPSTDHGLSLTAVNNIASSAGMRYQMAFRSQGSEIILPAVAHWKVGHYAAIVAHDDHGRYIVQDTTFGEDIRVSAATVDEESSGYFLVPEGPLPHGWRSVAAAEGREIWGRGDTGQGHEPATGCCGAGKGGIVENSPKSGAGGTPSPLTASAVELEVVGLQLHDTPVGYAPPVGPEVRFALYYSHRDTQQPATFSYTNFGPKWTFTWLSYITDTVNSNSLAYLYLPGGGEEPYTFPSTSATTSWMGPYTQSTMTRTVNGSGASTGFTITHADGSYEQFNQASGSLFFMTARADRAGNTVTLTYDSQMRITAITDAIGQVSTLTYGLSGSPLVVTQITDPFGRSATFNYSASGLLASITDVLGITSSYLYGQGSDPDFINTLTTPYGMTTFTYGDATTNPNLGSTRFLTTVDPLGRTSYVEFDQGIDAGDTSGGQMINPNLFPVGMNACNNYMQWRNTFVFDANQYQQATAGGGLNYSLGKVIHWMHTGNAAGRFKESEKEPLENRIWYSYPTQATGNNGGGICNVIYSPLSSGQTANGASDLPAQVAKVLDTGTTQLQQFQYNLNGNLTQSIDPVGRQMTYSYAANGIDLQTMTNTTNGTSQLLETRTYDSQHLPLTVTGANGKTAHYLYNAAGQMTRYTDQLGHVTSLTYDGTGHLKTLQGPISTAKYSYTYDSVSRVASMTDPAGSTVHHTYDADDRPLTSTYPDGTTTKLAYTLLDLTSSTDRLTQTTHYKYDADRELTSTTDPDSNTTKQGYNLAGVMSSITDGNGRITTFSLDDESRPVQKNFANGTYYTIVYQDSWSLVDTITDALQQTTTYTYNPDNSLATVSYNATQSTPSVSFAYDPTYLRVTSMTDGVGTTTYNYYPVTLSPALGAAQLQSVTSPVAGASVTDTIVYSYDALNRVVGYTINGAAQTVGFDALGRVSSTTNPLDSFTYTYNDGTARVTGMSSTSGPTASLTYFGPTGDELLQQLNYTTHSGGTSLAQFGYTYNADDLEKTLAVSSPSSQNTTYSYDTANRVISGLIGTGAPQYAYGYDHASNLTSITPNGPTQSYTYTSTNTITTGTYDANGSTLVLVGKSYKWDGANRLVRFANAANNTGSNFTYDGLNRLVRVVDTRGGTITADHSYTWCGTMRCLAHDNTQSNSPVSTQYFSQGLIISGTPYYFVTDQLGSVTELVTSGTVASQFAYDPYGNQSTISGTVLSDIGYAGYFYHAASGLDFALYRVYDPAHARWLNRDPIGEAGGTNLYAYTSGNPVSNADPSGLLEMCRSGLNALNGNDMGPLHHEFMCWKDADGKEVCRGYGRDEMSSIAKAVLLKVGGHILKDEENKSANSTVCGVDDKNKCMDDCASKEWAKLDQAPPKYGLLFGANCQSINNSVAKKCAAQCKAPQPKVPESVVDPATLYGP